MQHSISVHSYSVFVLLAFASALSGVPELLRVARVELLKQLTLLLAYPNSTPIAQVTDQLASIYVDISPSTSDSPALQVATTQASITTNLIRTLNKTAFYCPKVLPILSRYFVCHLPDNQPL